MERKIEGLAHGTLITTDKGIVPVQHLAVALEEGVGVRPWTNFKVSNLEGEWVDVETIFNLGYQKVNDFELADGRNFTIGYHQSVLTTTGFSSDKDLKKDVCLKLHSECELEYPEVTKIEGLECFPLVNNNLSFMKLLGMLTAFGRIVPTTGVIGLVNVVPKIAIEFNSLMESVFKFNSHRVVKTKQTKTTINLHYEQVGLARWLSGLLQDGIPYEVLRSSEPEMRMFLRGMYDPRYTQVQTILRGAKYVYNGSNFNVAKQTFSMLRVLGYIPKFIIEDNKTFSVLTVGINVHEDELDRQSFYKNREPRNGKILETFVYSELIYRVELSKGNNFIVDGLVIRTGE